MTLSSKLPSDSHILMVRVSCFSCFSVYSPFAVGPTFGNVLIDMHVYHVQQMSFHKF